MARIRLKSDDRGAWSAVGGILVTLFGGGGFALWIAAHDSGSDIPTWPLWPAAILALIGLYILLAPLLGLKGWPSTTAPAEDTGAGPVTADPVAELVEKASKYVTKLSTPQLSEVPREKAAKELSEAAGRARAESPAAADLGLTLAATTDPKRAAALEKKLRKSL